MFLKISASKKIPGDELRDLAAAVDRKDTMDPLPITF